MSWTLWLHLEFMSVIMISRSSTSREQVKEATGEAVANHPVFEIMRESRHKIATKDQDKVFALHGLFQEMPIGRIMPPPDYSKSIEDIYREFTIACIESDRRLCV